eukprot:g25924.t1
MRTSAVPAWSRLPNSGSFLAPHRRNAIAKGLLSRTLLDELHYTLLPRLLQADMQPGDADLVRMTRHVYMADGLREQAEAARVEGAAAPAAAASADKPRLKPAPDLLLAAMADTRIPSQRAILIGDNLSDLLAGQAAGVPLAVLVTSSHHGQAARATLLAAVSQTGKVESATQPVHEAEISAKAAAQAASLLAGRTLSIAIAPNLATAVSALLATSGQGKEQEGDPHGLKDRFISKHKIYFSQALAEINAGRKTSHWSWYIFPTPPFIVDGIEHGSSMNRYYALRTDQQIKAYLKLPAVDGVNLRRNYIDIMTAVGQQVAAGISLLSLVGSLDEHKVTRKWFLVVANSCSTLG